MAWVQALYGGRWNPVGTEAIYAAQSRALAALEILVHFDVVPQDFVLTEIALPDRMSILHIDDADLPLGWERDPLGSSTQDIGKKWVDEARFAVISAPSSIVLADRNFVIDPKHPEFGSIHFVPQSRSNSIGASSDIRTADGNGRQVAAIFN